MYPKSQGCSLQRLSPCLRVAGFSLSNINLTGFMMWGLRVHGLLGLGFGAGGLGLGV